jgi:hypothetical protein
VEQAVTAWDQPRARRALSLRLREGLTAGPAGADLLDAIEQTLAQLKSRCCSTSRRPARRRATGKPKRSS